MMSIAANYFYNAFYQLLSMVIPFITVPYVSRALGAEGIGINAYAGSILQYFILLGSLGIGLYGTRCIAYSRDNRKLLSKNFWSIFRLQFTLCIISLSAYILFVVIFVEQYKLIYIILSLNLGAAAIDVTWLFAGMEEFKKLVIRSIFFRIIGVICIFLFVHSPDDVWKYTAISSLSAVLGQIVMWGYVKRLVTTVKVNFIDLKVHIKPSLALFLPQIAIQVYLVVNRTMLGIMAGSQQVGLFDSSDKIVKMSLALLTAMGGVMLPRVANSFAHGDDTKVEYYVYTALNFVSYLGVPMMLGLIGISRQFVPWFFGENFIGCSTLIIILSPVVLIIAWSNVLGYQYMIPTNKTPLFTTSVAAGAAVSLVLNLIFIRRFGAAGAAAATAITEAVVVSVQIYLLRSYIKVHPIKNNLLKYFLAGALMFVIITIIGVSLGVSAKTTFIQIIAGMIIYISSLFLLRSDINRLIFTRLFHKILRRLLGSEARA